MSELTIQQLANAILIIHSELSAQNPMFDSAARQRILERADSKIKAMVLGGKRSRLERDFIIMMRDLALSATPDTRQQIEKRLVAEEGISSENIVSINIRDVSKLITRGFVKSIGEYRLLREYVDHIEATAGEGRDLRKAQGILDEFEASRR